MILKVEIARRRPLSIYIQQYFRDNQFKRRSTTQGCQIQKRTQPQNEKGTIKVKFSTKNY
jgi:hypothetical protein